VITLIGTGHVFDLRKRLQREVLARAPEVVCLELDAGRLQALLAKQRGGDAPLMYKLLAEFQGRMASEEGILPGDEMLAAFEAAQAARVPVELIDLDAQVAFKRLWDGMGLVEKARFLGSALVGTVLPKSYVEKELAKMQQDYASALDQLAKDYPTVKRVLVDERNAHMAARLAGLGRQGKQRIVAVVGDAHVDGIRGLLAAQGLEVEAVRLQELRAPERGASLTFSTQVDWEPPPGRL
jgi:pheromone shutdown protein TraB